MELECRFAPSPLAIYSSRSGINKSISRCLAVLSGTADIVCRNHHAQDLGHLKIRFLSLAKSHIKSANECQEKIPTFYEDSHLGEPGSLGVCAL